MNAITISDGEDHVTEDGLIYRIKADIPPGYNPVGDLVARGNDSKFAIGAVLAFDPKESTFDVLVWNTRDFKLPEHGILVEKYSNWQTELKEQLETNEAFRKKLARAFVLSS